MTVKTVQVLNSGTYTRRSESNMRCSSNIRTLLTLNDRKALDKEGKGYGV